jgi:hypothetical protein
MMDARLQQNAEDLRAAVESGALEQAAAMLPDFRAALESALETLAPGNPRALQLVSEARDWMGRMRQLALCRRAHLALELDNLACLGSYTAERRCPRTWEIRG